MRWEDITTSLDMFGLLRFRICLGASLFQATLSIQLHVTVAPGDATRADRRPSIG